jgi:4,4'-diaponeurosporenoate glycosyltransferase
VATGLAYAVGALALVRVFRRVGNFAWWLALVFPVPLAFYLTVFSRSIQRRRQGVKTPWKGRDVA